MLDRDGFRPNVGIILLNQKNQVFWGKRIRTHSWQFPQGGIDRGESPEQALEALAQGLSQKMLHGALAELHAGDHEARERARAAIEHFFLRDHR